MSLMQLLMVGRSLNTAQDRPSPYRVTQQNLLPHFGGKSHSDEATILDHAAQASRVAAAVRHEMTTQEDKPSDEPAGTKTPSPTSGQAKPGQHWRFWLRNPFRLDPEAKKPTEVIQGELVLESVKVVRNDLSDADLELIPGVKVKAKMIIQDQPMPSCREPLVWPRVTARVFGVGRS